MFHFKQFSVKQDKSAMKVGTDGVLLGAWTDVSEAKKILDIGTGTGIIALILAQKSSAEVDAIDVDELSCRQAKENIAASKFSDRITVFHQSLQQFSEESERKYDLIVTNPPFYNNSLKSHLDKKNIARHSDAALPSSQLINSVLKLLDKNGKFCLIFPKPEGEKFISEAEKKNLFCTKITHIFPKTGKECIRLLMQFEKQQRQPTENSLVIETGIQPNDFTEEYKFLTKDFYLKF